MGKKIGKNSAGKLLIPINTSLHEWELPPLKQIHAEGIRSLEVDNAGGNSQVSEAYSIDYFCSTGMGGRDVILEKEVKYWIDYKMVDFICTMGEGKGYRVGVSVTRAMGFPSPDCFTYEDALLLITKKVRGLVVARNSVIKSQRFFVSILHVWCQSVGIATMIHKAWDILTNDPNNAIEGLKGSLHLLLTVCPNPILYSNHRINTNKNE